MAKAMTAVAQECPPEMEEDDQAEIACTRGETRQLRVLVAKNVLFWGSIGLSIYALYAVVSAL